MSIRIDLIQVDDTPIAQAGSKIRYDLQVTNNGDDDEEDVITSVQIRSNLNLTYDPVLVFDTVLGESYNIGDDNQNGRLDPLETWTYRTFYEVTPADVANNGAIDGVADGAITNTATVTASGPSGSATEVSSTSVPLLERKPAIAIRQSASPSPARAGDTVTFAIDVSNTGNLSLDAPKLTSSPVTPVRSLDGPSGFNLGDVDKDGTFDVGETWKYAASYAVTQQDITNRGSVDGSADGALTNTVSARASLAGENAATASTSTRVDLITGTPPCDPRPPCHPKPPICKPKPPVCKPKPICRPKPCKGFWGGWMPFLGHRGDKGCKPVPPVPDRKAAPAASIFRAGGVPTGAGWDRNDLFRGGAWEWWSGLPVVSPPGQRGWFG